jgi:hypothetical protein
LTTAIQTSARTSGAVTPRPVHQRLEVEDASIHWKVGRPRAYRPISSRWAAPTHEIQSGRHQP